MEGLGRAASGKRFHRRALLAAAPAAVGAWALSGSAAEALAGGGGLFNLADFGAVGDGMANDGPALQAALNAMGTAGGGVLVVPAGRYAIATPVVKNFADIATAVVILGRGSASQIIPKTGGGADAVTIQNAESVLIENLVWTGTPSAPSDAKAALRFDSCLQATLRRCDFYGISSLVADGAIVYSSVTDLRVLQCSFRGSFGSTPIGTPVLENKDWRGLHVEDTDFIDYGTLNGVFRSKNNVSPGAFAWIKVGRTYPLTDCNKQNVVRIHNVRMDEGAYFGIYCAPYLAESARVANVIISGLRVCASGVSGANSVQIRHTERVRIEHSWFGYVNDQRAAINLIDVGDALIDACKCEAGANLIQADGTTNALTVRETVYGELRSDAKRTIVIQDGQRYGYHKAVGDIPAKTLVSWADTGTEQVKVTPAGAGGAAVIGVSRVDIDAGAKGLILRDQGSLTSVWSDGTSAITPGDALGVSTKTAGRVRPIAAGPQVGRATSGVPAWGSGIVVTMDLLGGFIANDASAAPTLLNGWSNHGNGFGAARCARDATNTVELSGVVAPGTTTAGTAIFTLPVGFRPVSDALFLAATNGGVVQLRVRSNGNVTIESGTVNTFIALDSISFATPAGA